jgi:hypothetical protein
MIRDFLLSLRLAGSEQVIERFVAAAGHKN